MGRGKVMHPGYLLVYLFVLNNSFMNLSAMPERAPYKAEADNEIVAMTFTSPFNPDLCQVI